MVGSMSTTTDSQPRRQNPRGTGSSLESIYYCVVGVSLSWRIISCASSLQPQKGRRVAGRNRESECFIPDGAVRDREAKTGLRGFQGQGPEQMKRARGN